MEEKVSRREFIKDSGKLLVSGSLFLGMGVLIPKIASSAVKKVDYNWEDHDYAYTIEIALCIGCGMCVRACKRENKVPDTYFRTWVEQYSFLKNGEVVVDSPNGGVDGFSPKFKPEKLDKAFFVPKLCNHCRKPRCVQVCPVNASFITKEGVVLTDKKHCVGCAYCVQVCPYGARYFHPVLKIADKCTWCYHRITKDNLPACVLACPRKARKFGDLKNPKSAIYNIIRKKYRISELKPELKSHTRVYYVGLYKEVR